MKIRNGFVSNSSSSSFVIAIKNGTTVDDIATILKENYASRIHDFIHGDMKFCRSLKDEIEDENTMRTENMTKKETFDFVAGRLASSLKWMIESSKNYGLKMNDWTFLTETYGSEDGYPMGLFMYQKGNIDTDVFKIVSTPD